MVLIDKYSLQTGEQNNKKCYTLHCNKKCDSPHNNIKYDTQHNNKNATLSTKALDIVDTVILSVVNKPTMLSVVLPSVVAPA
jgi:hypothetical protein